jgi:hypothetical protein
VHVQKVASHKWSLDEASGEAVEPAPIISPQLSKARVLPLMHFAVTSIIKRKVFQVPRDLPVPSSSCPVFNFNLIFFVFHYKIVIRIYSLHGGGGRIQSDNFDLTVHYLPWPLILILTGVRGVMVCALVQDGDHHGGTASHSLVWQLTHSYFILQTSSGGLHGSGSL